MLLLLIRSMLPGMVAAGEGQWIEICADGGTAWVQVDETGEKRAPCPDCQTCSLCAVFAPVPPVAGEALHLTGEAQPADVRISSQTVTENPAQFWPDNRGPPRAQKIQTDPTANAPMDLNSNIGAAPWS